MKKQIDFIRNRRIYYTISLIIIAAGLILSFVMGIKLDIEFSGGTILSYVYDGEINEADFKKSVEDNLGLNVSVTTGSDFTTGRNKIMVEVKSKSGLNSDKQFRSFRTA